VALKRDFRPRQPISYRRRQASIVRLSLNINSLIDEDSKIFRRCRDSAGESRC
jgi:hypothetical protein